MPPVSLRLATWRDCWTVFRWKNMTANVLVSSTGRRVTRKEHLAWFKETLEETNRLLYIIDDGKGMVRLDREGDRVVLSIYIASVFRGNGLGRRAIRQGVLAAWTAWDVDEVVAFVRKDNRASRQAFASAGFEPIAEQGGILTYARRADGLPEPHGGQPGPADPAVHPLPGSPL